MPRSPWIAHPSIDLIVGCGGWSLPLLAVAYGLSGDAAQAWAPTFYTLALVVNYPHYMATVYRAYGGGVWRRHTPYTVWATLALIAAGAAAHFDVSLVPILFSAYVMWSPWHYSGQNYGLLMMFARRGGYQVSRTEQRMLKAAFVASYVMLLASFNDGPSPDPLVLSAQLPASAVDAICIAALVVFVAGSLPILVRVVRERRGKSVAPPMMLLSTQALWFVAPVVVAIVGGVAAPQTRYSSGVLALMHSAQYLWITQHFARREQGEGWSASRYWVAVIAGGIALFLPVPWLASTVGHLDFTISMLIVTAIVNLHHFMIDGVVWKLRDPRVAAALTTDAEVERAATVAPLMRGRTVIAAVAVIALVGLAGIDQWRYRLASSSADTASLQRAIALNPYDASPQSRLLRILIESGEHDRAREQLDALIAAQPHNVEARINAGVLARRMGRTTDAIAHWRAAVERAPNQSTLHLYLAEALHETGQAAEAAPHYQAYLESLTRDPAAARDKRDTIAPIVLKFADALAQAGRTSDATMQYELAARIASQTGQNEIQAAAQQRLGR